jgi:hypothetical protein
MIEANIWSAFQKAWFYFDAWIEPYRIRFDGEKRRRTPAFREILGIGLPAGKTHAPKTSRKVWMDYQTGANMIAPIRFEFPWRAVEIYRVTKY